MRFSVISERYSAHFKPKVNYGLSHKKCRGPKRFVYTLLYAPPYSSDNTFLVSFLVTFPIHLSMLLQKTGTYSRRKASHYRSYPYTTPTLFPFKDEIFWGTNVVSDKRHANDYLTGKRGYFSLFLSLFGRNEWRRDCSSGLLIPYWAFSNMVWTRGLEGIKHKGSPV